MKTTQLFTTILTGNVKNSEENKSGQQKQQQANKPKGWGDRNTGSTGKPSENKQPGEGMNREQNIQSGDSNFNRNKNTGGSQGQELNRNRGDIGKKQDLGSNAADLSDEDMEDEVE